MSIQMNVLAGIIGFIVTFTAAGATGITAEALYFFSGVVGMVTFGSWTYSPLPDCIGFMAMNPNTSWGWTSDD